jgi:uncharacterized protein
LVSVDRAAPFRSALGPLGGCYGASSGANELVGTDLAQSVPLIFSAAAGHLLFGDFSMAVTLPLIIGGMPGTYLGAHLSSSLPSGLIRRALAFVLLASSLKTFGVGNGLTLALLGVSLLIAPPLWMLTRRRHGFPALARNALLRTRAYIS